jgi:hypothetical protein
MRNETLDYGVVADDRSMPTAVWGRDEPFGQALLAVVKKGLAAPAIAVMLSFTDLTSSITYDDPRMQLGRSSTSSWKVVMQVRHRRKVTLAQAWHQVGRLFAEAEKMRHLQRQLDTRESLVDDPDNAL